MKTKIAGCIRILTAPPLMAALMLSILYMRSTRIFSRPLDYGYAMICLFVFPLTAYLLQDRVPALRKGGRELQRTLAFMMSVVGYALLLVYALSMRCSSEYVGIALFYALSVMLLSLINLSTPYRASGHASGLAAVPLCLMWNISWYWGVPGVIAGIALVWSSLELKRHTGAELALGFAVSGGAFLIARLVIGLR